MIMQIYLSTFEIKYRLSVKTLLNICFTTVISCFSFALPTVLHFTLFFNVTGQREQSYRRRGGREHSFLAPACPDTETASKPGTHRTDSQSQ